MDYQYLTFCIDDGVATITLNRPEAGNTFHQHLADELDEVSRYCLIRNDVEVVLLKANGKLFSGGGDLAYMQSSGDNIDIAIKKLADRLHSAYASFSRMSVPVVASVQGTAAGIGLSLSLLADITIASDKAKFAAAYGGVGLSPDGGLTHILPRVIGVKRASYFLLTNQVITAQQALEWGMVNEVVPPSELDDTVNAVVETLKDKSADANASVKSLLLQSQQHSLEAQMHLEGIQLSRNAASDNGQEGINAYLERRLAKFTKH